MMRVLRWLPICRYVLGLGGFLVQLVSMRHQFPARIVMIPHPDGRPDDMGDAKAFLIFLALASLLASAPFAGTFWHLRSKPPASINIPRKGDWRQPEHWRNGCDSLFFSSFWLALAQLIYLMGWFSLVVRANQRQPPSMDGGSLHTLWVYCMAASLAWVGYAIWFVCRSPGRRHLTGW